MGFKITVSLSVDVDGGFWYIRKVEVQLSSMKDELQTLIKWLVPFAIANG